MANSFTKLQIIISRINQKSMYRTNKTDQYLTEHTRPSRPSKDLRIRFACVRYRCTWAGSRNGGSTFSIIIGHGDALNSRYFWNMNKNGVIFLLDNWNQHQIDAFRAVFLVLKGTIKWFRTQSVFHSFFGCSLLFFI